jgi:hypothetical protein
MDLVRLGVLGSPSLDKYVMVWKDISKNSIPSRLRQSGMINTDHWLKEATMMPYMPWRPALRRWVGGV